MLSLWYLSFITSIVTFGIALFKLSWPFMLVSSVPFIPIGYYFWGANNAFKYIGFIPILLLLLTIFLWILRTLKKE